MKNNMRPIKRNHLSKIFEQLTSRNEIHKLTESNLDSINMLAHSILRKVADGSIAPPPIIPGNAIDYSNQADKSAIDYCLFQLAKFEWPQSSTLSIYPYHVAAAMHLFNAAYMVHQIVRSTNTEIGTNLIFKADDCQKQIPWINRAMLQVLAIARTDYYLEQKLQARGSLLLSEVRNLSYP